jgi:cyanophycin synthetase
VGGVEVILDYGHNVAAMQALGEAVVVLGIRKTVLALTLPGGRRDEDLLATLDATRSFADAYVLYDSHDRRGRDVDELPRLLHDRLPKNVPCVYGANVADATRRAWQQVCPGERLIVIVEEGDDVGTVLQTMAQSVSRDTACVAPMSAEKLYERAV